MEVSTTRQPLLQYYNDLEKYVIHYYNKQLNRINYVLKQYVRPSSLDTLSLTIDDLREQAKVKGDVRVQMKSETKKTIMTETDRFHRESRSESSLCNQLLNLSERKLSI